MRDVLVVALDPVVPARMQAERVLVVAPALRSGEGARRRAHAWVERLERDGVRAEGRVGDTDPLRAIAEALDAFPADEILVAAWPTASAEHLATRARARFGLPTTRRLGPAVAPEPER